MSFTTAFLVVATPATSPLEDFMGVGETNLSPPPPSFFPPMANTVFPLFIVIPVLFVLVVILVFVVILILPPLLPPDDAKSLP
jgi:hypothetical protein